jgi:tubulin polyglutamylase TTLL5
MEDYATVFEAGGAEGGAGAGAGAGAASEGQQRVYTGGTSALHYRVKSSRAEVCVLITDVFGQSLPSWEELPSGLGLGLSWNFLWSWGRPRLNFDHLLVWQKVNHFTESRQLTRKDMLKRNIQSLTEMGKGKKSGEFFEIMPLTFLLPAEYKSFVKTFHEIENTRAETGCKNIWILKPIGLSRGRGISMVTDANTLTYSQASVLQRYVERPMCLDGYKFDLRLYILVTSFSPLEAFIYKEGFARLSTHKYSMDPKDIDNKFVHLTNSSIQKQNSQGPSQDNPTLVGPPSDAGGSKISLMGDHGLWRRLRSGGYDVDHIWTEISALIVKSLVAVDDKVPFQPSCFEVYGYDVLIDQDLRPWLIEVNASPAMARDAYVDVRVKNAMIKDTVQLLDPAPYDRAALLKVIKRRLKQVSSNLHQPAPSAKSDTDLASDIKLILGDYVPRKYGEEPACYGDYERLCPNTKVYNQAMKLKGKIFNRSSAAGTAATATAAAAAAAAAGTT